MWLVAGLAAACVAAWTGGDPWTAVLRYDRAAVLQGEWWRLVSCHAIHLGGRHLLLNLLGLALVALLFLREFTAVEWGAIAAGAAVAMAIGFLLLEPQLQWYVGLSGILHGVIAAGAVSWFRRDMRLLALTLSSGLLGKLVYEQWLGPVSQTVDLPVIVDAHLYGALGGAAASLACLACRTHGVAKPRLPAS